MSFHLLFLLLASLTSAEEPADLPFHLPVPDGWRTETIPFPLAFAPELDYEGVEELRFSPGMFDAEAEDFWTYAFVWWIRGDSELDAARLGSDLAAYFEGLSRAVARQNGFEPEAPEFRAELEELTVEDGGNRIFRGHAETLDAFVTRESVRLEVRVEIIPCDVQGHQAVLFELSPRATEHAVWRALTGIRSGFRCQAG